MPWLLVELSPANRQTQTSSQSSVCVWFCYMCFVHKIYVPTGLSWIIQFHQIHQTHVQLCTCGLYKIHLISQHRTQLRNTPGRTTAKCSLTDKMSLTVSCLMSSMHLSPLLWANAAANVSSIVIARKVNYSGDNNDIHI